MSDDIQVSEGAILETLNNKVDIDFDNVPGNSVSFARISREVTNCITEIPQRIKVEFKNETLTLKAGSIITIPNGEGVFNEVTISDDISEFQNTAGTTKQNLCFVDKEGRLWLIRTEQCFSGATKPTYDNGWMVWYDTVNNVINFYQSLTDHNTVTTTFSLPFAIGPTKGDGTYHFTSIDQVFNGMGYIGSTIWVDKGVKGLIPNGRNEDGSLKNIERTTTNLIVRTLTSQNGYIHIGCNLSNSLQLYGPTYHYDEENNFNTDNGGINASTVIIGQMQVTNNKISSFNSKFPFRAVDYNEASRLGMPSNKYINLTLGASGTEYIAPATGWVIWHRMASVGQDIHLSNLTSTGDTQCLSMYPYASVAGKLEAYIPVKKGDRFRTGFSANASDSNKVNCFRFIYAEGEI